ncbi:uncharacterized protein LOC124489118 isoform X3 [Hypomesus transpacificus]|uniref:uncharacterized protein LOC124489118 isoform X3 n=1 Tax=Hypomesus transpacificus TaxID=137520 RepID=UPI001F073095|nr:uncharacterized protein LOC124489118 isoform X3 [Hypomesus transpacificus]
MADGWLTIKLVTAVVKMPQSSKRSKAAKKRMAAPEDHGSPVEVKLPREKKAKPLGVGPPPYPKAKHTKPNSTNKQTEISADGILSSRSSTVWRCTEQAVWCHQSDCSFEEQD